MTLQALAIYLAFEQGKVYERLYNSLGLRNVMDFNDIAFANSCGAQWQFNGDMSNLSKIWKCKITSPKDENKIAELNKITDNIKLLQQMPLDDREPEEEL